jgi:hypothetical protein
VLRCNGDWLHLARRQVAVPDNGTLIVGHAASSYRYFTHQRQLVPVGVPEFAQPQLSRWRTVNEVRAGAKLDAPFLKRREYRVDVDHLEVDHRSALAWLIRFRDADEQSDIPRLKKAHLRRSREKEPQAKRVTVESDGPIQVVNRNEKLADGRV